MTQPKHPHFLPRAGSARSRKRGFSLIEVLVAAALLLVILLALFSLVTAGMMRAYGGKKMTQASMVAQTVLERANIEAPQSLLGAAATDTTATRTWSKNARGTADSTVTPAAESGTASIITQRNNWRTLLVTSDLPASTAKPATLTVTMTPVPSGRTFANAAMVRTVVNLTWFEWGTRRRTVQLQAMNIRAAF
jgi:prepilin-type N-terminal cleavage/methylation domain-containing protein